MRDLSLEGGEVEAHGECGGEGQIRMMACEQPLRDLDGARSRDGELPLQVADDRGGEEGAHGQPARHAARESFDAPDVMVGDQIVQPFAIDIERKCANGNVVRAQVIGPNKIGTLLMAA